MGDLAANGKFLGIQFVYGKPDSILIVFAKMRLGAS
jgi:hypothetical protein